MIKNTIQNFLPGVSFLLRAQPAGIVTKSESTTVTNVYQIVFKYPVQISLLWNTFSNPSRVIFTGYRKTCPPRTASGSEIEAIIIK